MNKCKHGEDVGTYCDICADEWIASLPKDFPLVADEKYRNNYIKALERDLEIAFSKYCTTVIEAQKNLKKLKEEALITYLNATEKAWSDYKTLVLADYQESAAEWIEVSK